MREYYISKETRHFDEIELHGYVVTLRQATHPSNTLLPFLSDFLYQVSSAFSRSAIKLRNIYDK